MSFFLSGTFWFIMGIIFTIVILAFKVWMEDREVAMNWWKWLLWGFWILLAGFTIAFIFTSLGEGEPTAALKGGILFSLITIIYGVGTWRLITRKK